MKSLLLDRLLKFNVGLVGGIERQFEFGDLGLVLLLEAGDLGLQLGFGLGKSDVELFDLNLVLLSVFGRNSTTHEQLFSLIKMNNRNLPQGFDLLLLLHQTLLIVVADLSKFGNKTLVLGFLLFAQCLGLLVGGGQLLAFVLQSLDLDLLFVDTTVGIVQVRLGLGQIVCKQLSKQTQEGVRS